MRRTRMRRDHLMRVISVTRRYIRFLFERAETVNARIEVRELGEGDWALPTTDDSHVGEDTD